MEPDTHKPLPPPLLSIIPLAVLIVLLFFTVRMFGSDTLNGGSQVMLLLAAAVCIFIAVVFCRVKWEEIEIAIGRNIFGIATAVIVLLLVGALSGTWMISGVVPTLIYYGMQIIHPHFFLVSSCLICCLVSVMTGSSWTTVATIGIALMGIGQAQGFSEGWIAGAIISGAYFGDKVSPLSDTTILAASVTGTPLFTHIRYLMYTTIPSLLIACTVFAVMGFTHREAGLEQMTLFSSALQARFNISLWLLAVPLLTGVLIARRMPPLVTLFLSAALGAVFAVFFQPGLLREVSGMAETGFLSSFKGALISFYGETRVEMGNAALNDLVSTRGMGGMMNTVWLILCAMCFGGAMTGSRMIESIVTLFVSLMKRRTGLVASTVFSGFFMNVCTADQYISIILTGNMFKDIYREKGYETRLLGRAIEDGATVTSVLVPWNTCGMVQSSVLGVATFTYLPYCLFNYISPLMSILVAATGYSIRKAQAKT